MPKPGVHLCSIIRFQNDAYHPTDDLVVVEEPLEIRIGYGAAHQRLQKRISVTMRTPGNDFELALGFLYTEKIIDHADHIQSIKYCTEAQSIEANENIVRVELKPDVTFDSSALQRNFYTTSSCGICGKESIEAVKLQCQAIQLDTPFSITSEFILALPQLLNNAQQVFKHTGGLHACGLFNSQQELLLLREDIGRHNALDKLIGAAIVKNNEWLKQGVLLLSGRAGFELIQKAAVAGLPCICSVGAPSSLTVDTAKALGITLIGFLKNDRFNVYNDSLQLLKK
jgi:FdhD protein